MLETTQGATSAEGAAVRYDYLIVGGGMAADSAARGIRANDPDGSIGILSADIDEPYARPALSKKLWTDPDFTWDDATLSTRAETGADVHTMTRVTAVHPDRHEVEAETEVPGDPNPTTRIIGYGKLLLATGGIPNAPGFEEGERVILYRSAADYRRLRELAGAKPDGSRLHAAVVGGSYIGTEIASSLAQNDCEVTLVIDDDVLGGSVFPPDLAHRIQSLYLDAGVQILPHSRVKSARQVDSGVEVKLESGEAVAADAVIVGFGIEPATAVAEDAGLRVDDGVLVDDHLRTSAEGVYAAGDVANYPDRILGQRRVEHVDNATEMGEAAGRIMSGEDEPYAHTPYYYSVIFGHRYEAVGRLDASLATVEDWQGEDRGVVYYLDGGQPVGVLLWNVPDARDAARRVLVSEPPADPRDLRGAIS